MMTQYVWLLCNVLWGEYRIRCRNVFSDYRGISTHSSNKLVSVIDSSEHWYMLCFSTKTNPPTPIVILDSLLKFCSFWDRTELVFFYYPKLWFVQWFVNCNFFLVIFLNSQSMFHYLFHKHHVKQEKDIDFVERFTFHSRASFLRHHVQKKTQNVV